MLVLRRFGYSCYGCCEKMDGRYDDLFRELPNLKRISVSPWADVEEAAERLEHTEYIYSRKPNPLLVTDEFDETSYRRGLAEFLKTTQNCNVEFILKDLRTCNNPENLVKWVNITQEMVK